MDDLQEHVHHWLHQCPQRIPRGGPRILQEQEGDVCKDIRDSLRVCDNTSYCFLDWKIFTYSEYDIVYYCIKRDNSCLQLCWVVLHGADWICQGFGLPAWGQVQRDGIQPQLERGVHRQQLVPGGLPLGHPLSHLREKHARELGEYSILTPHYNSVSLKFSPGVKLVIILSQKLYKRCGLFKYIHNLYLNNYSMLCQVVFI